MRFLRHPVNDTGLLRMTEWVDEIATSHRTLLAIRLCHNPFHTPRIAWKWKTPYIYLQFLVIYSQYYC